MYLLYRPSFSAVCVCVCVDLRQPFWPAEMHPVGRSIPIPGCDAQPRRCLLVHRAAGVGTSSLRLAGQVTTSRVCTHGGIVDDRCSDSGFVRSAIESSPSISIWIPGRRTRSHPPPPAPTTQLVCRVLVCFRCRRPLRYMRAPPNRYVSGRARRGIQNLECDMHVR